MPSRGRCPNTPVSWSDRAIFLSRQSWRLRQAIENFADPANAARLFNEVQDDRYVLETALAGHADLLTTADVGDFARRSAIYLERDDVVLFPFSGRTLVIATPAFAAHWLRRGVVPDAAFVADNPDEFRIRQAR